MSDDMNLVQNVRMLSHINSEIDKLTEQKKELEAYFFDRGVVDTEDTKYKSVTYADPNSQASVTITKAESLTIDAKNYLEEAMGAAYKDFFKEELKPTVKAQSKEIERMLIGVFSDDYVKLSPDEVIEQLPCDGNTKKALARKLKGAKFDTDRDNLMNIGKLSLNDASDYAYMFSEAVIWQTFCRLQEISGKGEDELLRSIKLGVAVSSSSKITVT